MPLGYVNSGIGIAGLAAINAGQRRDSQDVIAMLQFADLGRGPGTLHMSGVARVDLQGHTQTHVNIQVQIGSMSVAAALIDNRLLDITNAQNQQGAKNAAVSALNRSLNSGTIWQVNGTLP